MTERIQPLTVTTRLAPRPERTQPPWGGGAPLFVMRLLPAIAAFAGATVGGILDLGATDVVIDGGPGGRIPAGMAGGLLVGALLTYLASPGPPLSRVRPNLRSAGHDQERSSLMQERHAAYSEQWPKR
jgi:hypothetical protein